VFRISTGGSCFTLHIVFQLNPGRNSTQICVQLIFQFMVCVSTCHSCFKLYYVFQIWNTKHKLKFESQTEILIGTSTFSTWFYTLVLSIRWRTISHGIDVITYSDNDNNKPCPKQPTMVNKQRALPVVTVFINGKRHYITSALENSTERYWSYKIEQRFSASSLRTTMAAFKVLIVCSTV
jgi:hypothetical protein